MLEDKREEIKNFCWKMEVRRVKKLRSFFGWKLEDGCWK